MITRRCSKKSNICSTDGNLNEAISKQQSICPKEGVLIIACHAQKKSNICSIDGILNKATLKQQFMYSKEGVLKRAIIFAQKTVF